VIIAAASVFSASAQCAML